MENCKEQKMSVFDSYKYFSEFKLYHTLDVPKEINTSAKFYFFKKEGICLT